MLTKLKSLKNHKYFENISWIFGEKVLRMGLGLFIGVWVARYLGPEQYGLLSYISAILAFLGVFTYLGLYGILVNELVDKPDQTDINLGTVFYMKVIGSIVAYIILVVFALIASDFNSIKFWLFIVMGLSIFLRPFDVIEIFNESKVIVKYSMKAKSYAFIFMSIVKIILLLSGASLLFFGLVQPLESFLVVLFLLFYFNKQGNSSSKWRFDLNKAKEFINKSWKLILSFIFVTIYLKIDQVMLGWMIDDREVGIYSVAVRLSELWYFVPIAIISTITPELINTRKESYKLYTIKLQKLYDVLFVIAITMVLLISFFSEQVITTLYGDAYFQSASILVVHIWAGIFISMRNLFSRWIIMENLLILSLYTEIFGALLNVGLNFIFIPQYGAFGAAITTLISYAGASYFVLFLIKSTRGQAKMMTLSFLFPIRLLIKRNRIWKYHE